MTRTNIFTTLGVAAVLAVLALAAFAHMRANAAPPPTTADVTVVLDLQPDVSNEVCFLSTLPAPETFCLGDGEDYTLSGILGTLDLSLVNTAGVWQVKSADCEPDIPPFILSADKRFLRTIVSAGDVLTCTFTVTFNDAPTPVPTATLAPTATATATPTQTSTATPAPTATAQPAAATAPAPVIVQCANGQLVILGQTCPTVAPVVAPTQVPVGRITPPSTGSAGLVQE